MLDSLLLAFLAIPAPIRALGALLIALFCLVSFGGRLRAARNEPAGKTRELRRLRHYVAALRAVLVGGCSVLLALGWFLDVKTLVAIALVIGLEELYETTMLLGLLRHGLRVSTDEARLAGELP